MDSPSSIYTSQRSVREVGQTLYLVRLSSWLGSTSVGRILVGVARSGVALALEIYSVPRGPSPKLLPPYEG